jgi:two-component system sensor histidine kinase ChvG
VLKVRVDILKFFLVALAVTILLSIYLAGTIARPIRRLAAAAERVRRSHKREDAVSGVEDRQDDIGDLARALREMTDALWQRIEAIERFAADVAHEIKNPLTSLQSAVETARRVSDPAQQQKLLKIVEHDVHRLDRLITDISNASRLDAELMRANPEPVDLRAMFETLVDAHQSTTNGGPELVFAAAPGERLVVNGIEGRLVQVFRNLIANAVSFSPEAGTIRIHASREGAFVTVTVEDEGPGIPEGKEEAIFERFYSERPRGETYGTHSGLGLSISRLIVEALGGTIKAENRIDGGDVKGARFVVRLPAA